MESLSLDAEKMRIRWRQDKVLELCSKGHNQSEIARILQVGIATISRDVHYIQQDLYNKRKEFGEQIFAEYQKSLYGLDQVLKKLWESVDGNCSSSNSSTSSTTTSTDKSKERMQALSLIMQCYDKRLEIINSSPISYQAKEYMNHTRQLEQDVRQRERRIQEYLAKANLTQEQIEDIADPEKVF
jgi:uncharacterized protein YoxC